MAKTFTSGAGAVLVALLATARATAHEGESHGIAEVATAHRYETRAETAAGDIELTAIAGKEALWLFVATRHDNAPRSNLSIEVESDDRSLGQAEPAGPGTYRLAADWIDNPGKYLLTFTLRGDGVEELLSSTLTVPDKESGGLFGLTFPQRSRWVAAGIMLLAAGSAGWYLWRRRAGTR